MRGAVLAFPIVFAFSAMAAAKPRVVETSDPVPLGKWAPSVCALGFGEVAENAYPYKCSAVVTDAGLLTAKHCFDGYRHLREDLGPKRDLKLQLCCGGDACKDAKNYLPLPSASMRVESSAKGHDFRAPENIGTNRLYGYDHGLLELPKAWTPAALPLAGSDQEVERLFAGGKCFIAGYGSGSLVAGRAQRLTPQAALKAEPQLQGMIERGLDVMTGFSTMVGPGDSGGAVICEDPAAAGAFFVVGSDVGGSRDPNWNLVARISKKTPLDALVVVTPRPAR